MTSSPPDRRQLWLAATLTTRDSVLSHGSAGACWGFYRFERDYEVVTRPGRGGRRKHGKLLVFRSLALNGDVTRHRGVPITTAAKTLVDLAPGLDGKRMGRAFREAIRLKYTTAQRVLEAADRRHRHLHALATRYATLPYRRCRSDAEALALETLYDAGIELPHVNIKVAGEEADLTFLERKVIIEIDGPDYHRFKAEDARKTAIWRNAGFDVRRISSDAVYDAPAELIRLALRPPGYAQTA